MDGPLCARRFLAVCLFTEDDLVDLFAVDGNVSGGVDAETHLAAPYLYDDDLDIVANHDRLIGLTGQDKHESPPWGRITANRPDHLLITPIGYIES
jgi:hypothetical protein